MLREIPAALATELKSLEWGGRRGLEAAEAAASATLATLAALALHSDNPWWAAITAFMVTRAAPAEAVSRTILRIAGSFVGAIAALTALRFFVYQPPLFLLCLFTFAAIGAIGFVTSHHAYAWLIGAVTSCQIMLMAFDHPAIAFVTAVNRVVDVMIGSAASLIVLALSPAPPANSPAAATSLFSPPPLTFWRRGFASRLGRWVAGNRALVLHACRGSITVMLLPALAEWIAPVSPVTVGVTAVTVMSIPTTAIVGSDSRIVVQRALHRMIGCILGAFAGLALLPLFGQDFLLWLALLPCGVWLCSQIQTGSTGISYIGTQAMFAYVMTLVQSQGPPATIAPGLERLVGIVGGLAILSVVTMVISLIPLTASPTTAAAPASDH